jgi:hypothetical protein
MTRKWFANLVACAAVALCAQIAVAAGPAINVSATSIVATNVTPGARVAFFGVGREPKRYYSIIRRWSTVVTDTTLKGTATLQLDKAVAFNTLWIVADLTTGKYAVSAAPGFRAIPVHLERHALKRSGLHVSLFTFDRSEVDLLYLAPGGAWSRTVRDGYESDADSMVNGEIVLDLAGIESLVPGDAKPSEFMPGGAIIAIDPSSLEVFILNLDASLLREVR